MGDWLMTSSMTDFLVAKQIGLGPFIWTDDGCGGIVPDLFAANPCKRHDFGYRNYGKGLQLQRNETTRRWIDSILYENMLDECAKPEYFFVPSACRSQAVIFYGFVRGNPNENWNEPL